MCARETTSNSCKTCSRLYVGHRKLSDLIYDKLYINSEYIPIRLLRKKMWQWEWILGEVRLIKNEISHEEWLRTEKVYLYLHTMCYPTTLSNKYTKKFTSPYWVLKAYMDVLCRTIFNRFHKLLLPLLLYGVRTKIDVERIYYEELIILCKKICALSSYSCNPNFFIHIFDNYKKGIGFFFTYFRN